MKVAVLGLGKAGLPLAAVISEAGLDVVGFDISRQAVDLVNTGKAPFEEPGLDDILKKHPILATTDISDAKDCTAYIIIVPLFIDDNKKCDFSAIDDACRKIGSVLKKGDLVTLETTVPPRTTETRIAKALKDASGMEPGKDFCLAHSPERIMTGFSVERLRSFPKIVGGINPESTEAAYSLYKNFSNISKVSNARTAELVKVSEGIYRDINIAIANELWMISEKYGVDFWEMRKAASHDFCNILEPGSVGGHCIPVYPWFVLNEHEAPLTRTARTINDNMIAEYADRVDKITGGRGKVAVLGLTYRPGVKELAYTRSLPLAGLLKERGYEVYAWDPLMGKEEVESLGLKFLDTDMDAYVLMNKDCSSKAVKGKTVDVKNAL